MVCSWKKKIYNSSKQKRLDENYSLMHMTHKEGKSVVTERFIKHSMKNL